MTNGYGFLEEALEIVAKAVAKLFLRGKRTCVGEAVFDEEN